MNGPSRIDHSGASGTVESDLPEIVTAGARLAFRLVVKPGRACPAGARVALVRHWPQDWAVPQGDDSAAPDFLSASLQRAGRALPWRRERVLAWHPFDHAIVAQIDVAIGAEEAVVFAAPDLGVQTFIEEACPLSVRLDAAGTDDWVEIARLRQRVVGGAPHRLVATAPSDVVAGEDFRVHLRIEDVWGNPANFVPTRVEVAGAAGTIRAEEGAVLRLPLRIATPGLHRLQATAGGLTATSNPVLCHATAPTTRRHWGDIHAQSAIGCGARSIDAYFRHARDFAAADFASHQANCFLVSTPEWQETAHVTRALHEDGRFVTLLGVEWSGEPGVGGDHNLYWPGDAAPLRRCSHMHVADTSDIDTDLPHITDVHRHYKGQDVLMAVHVGGRTSNLAWHEPALETMVEVHSTHATSEWMVAEALRRGWRFGITGGSDGVDGRPAASHPGRQAVRNLRGGLTCVALPSLTRAALWGALRAGATYATNGPRILLDAAREAPGRFRIAVEGTAPIAAVTLLRGGAEVARIVAPAEDATPSGWWRLRWSGAKGRGNWSQTRMVWNGAATLRGALLREAKPWRWDTPAEGISGWSADQVSWRSITAGSWDGVLLHVDGVTPDSRLHLRAAGIDRELGFGESFSTTDDPPKHVVLEALPRRPAALSFAGTITDPAPNSEPHWLRVEQEDGGIAWSSPSWPDHP